MTVDLSFTQLIVGASPIIQFVIVLLIVISFASWTVIFKKYIILSQARAATDDFEDDFWSGIDLASLYTRITRQEHQPSGIEAIFLAGFQEFLRLRAQPTIDPESVVVGSQRAMRATASREIAELEVYLPLLATAGSTSPYIGLFGTVWGIMNSFIALSSAQHQITIAQVAPGLAEALITTALGLIVAIPAVVAYNRYLNDVDRLFNRYDTFTEEFSNILQRQIYSLRGGKSTPSVPDHANEGHSTQSSTLSSA